MSNQADRLSDISNKVSFSIDAEYGGIKVTGLNQADWFFVLGMAYDMAEVEERE